MDKDIEKLGKPLNYLERIQYAQLMRLDALCDMLSSIIEHIGNEEGIAVEENKVTDECIDASKRDFESMLKEDLKSLCDVNNVSYTSRDTKGDLIKKLRGE